MTREDILARIKAICDANINSDYHFTTEDKIYREQKAETAISSILANAKNTAKRSYAVFNMFKCYIENEAVTSAQYERSVRALADILRV